MSSSTLPVRRDPILVRRSRTRRRAGLLLLALFVLAGATGLLGTRTSEQAAEGGGYEMAVTYPSISRPGHAVRVQVQVRSVDGFDGEPLVLRYSTEYFEMFDENAFTPGPDAESAGPGYTEGEFSPPDGEVFVMTVDTRVEPARQRGENGFVSVMEDGVPVLTVEFNTFLWP